MKTYLKAESKMIFCLLFILFFQLCFSNHKTIPTRSCTVLTELMPKPSSKTTAVVDIELDTNGDGITDGDENLDRDGELNSNDMDKDGVPDLLGKDLSTIYVYQALTPNGDGDNDVWVIDNIELFPDTTVELFDRSGQRVFKTQRYKNYRDGYPNKGRMSNKKLPVGTYFYAIRLADKSLARSTYTGYLYINY